MNNIVSAKMENDDRMKFERLCKRYGVSSSIVINNFIKSAVNDKNVLIELMNENV